MTRPGWEQYYSVIAKAVAARGECKRRRVGALIVKDHSIISTGYNGAPPGARSCLDGACPRSSSNAEPGKDYAETGCYVIHAEVNAIIRAGKDRTEGATMYVTEEPCVLCVPLIRSAGILSVVHP